MKKSNGEGSVYKETRNGKPYYRAQITIGLDAEGKPIRKSFSGYKKSDVLQKMRDAQSKADKGFHISDSDMHFGSFFRMWIFTYKKNKVSPSTFSKYEGFYRNKLCNSMIEKIKLKDLSAIKLQSYFNHSIENGVLTANNAKQLLVVISSCLSFAVDEGYIFKNVAKSISLPKIQKTKRIAYTREEQRAITDALTEDKRDIAILLAFCTGMRLGEILALNKSDIDFEKCKVVVDKQYQYNYYIEEDLSKSRKYEIGRPKTEASVRILPLPKSVAEKILTMLKVEKVSFLQSDLLFRDEQGKPLERKLLPRRLEKIEKALGIEHKGFHCIRHSYATRLFEEGVPPKTVQVLMGHTDIQTTMDIYTHVMESAEKVAEDKLNSLFA